MDAQAETPINTMNFEEALAALEAIVQRLEKGQTSLEASIEDYTRGTQLKAHCEAQLKEARLKVEQIVNQAEDGSVTTENMAVEG